MATAKKRMTLVLRHPLDDRNQVEVEVLAQESGLHPGLVERLVRLGAVQPSGGTRNSPTFPRDAGARLARVARLRRDLGLNYAGAVLASELLARIDALEAHIDALEASLRRYESTDDRPR
jgi:chaperone modulatory protein CbpM